MKTILRIDASMRQVGSYSRTMADYFIARWKDKNRNGVVLYRDVDAHPVPHLSQHVVNVFFGSSQDVAGARLSNELIDEIKRIDELLIACPMYNFNIPSTLKAYIDHVVRVNETFRLRDNAYEGLLRNKKAFIITTMGGTKTGIRAGDAVEEYLETILAFMGITNIKTLAVAGTATESFTDNWQTRIDQWVN